MRNQVGEEILEMDNPTKPSLLDNVKKELDTQLSENKAEEDTSVISTNTDSNSNETSVE